MGWTSISTFTFPGPQKQHRRLFTSSISPRGVCPCLTLQSHWSSKELCFYHSLCQQAFTDVLDQTHCIICIMFGVDEYLMEVESSFCCHNKRPVICWKSKSGNTLKVTLAESRDVGLVTVYHLPHLIHPSVSLKFSQFLSITQSSDEEVLTPFPGQS